MAIAIDEFGGRNHAEGDMPLETLFGIARDAKASCVLYMVVDRPKMKWIKLSVRSYNMSGKLPVTGTETPR